MYGKNKILICLEQAEQQTILEFEAKMSDSDIWDYAELQPS